MADRQEGLYRNTIEIGLSRWESCDWGLIVAGSKGESVCPVAYIPKPHQIQAIDAALPHYEQNARGRLIMPCGTGKSLTGYWIASGLKAKAIIVAVPSLALIQQCVADWTREFLADGQRPEWLCVCSMTPEDTMSRIEQDEFHIASMRPACQPTPIRKRLQRGWPAVRQPKNRIHHLSQQ